MTELDTAVAALAKAIAPLIAREVVAQLRSGPVGMVDPTSSPLGRKRHGAAVRRRLAAGEPGAAIVGRRLLLTEDAIQDELKRLSSKPARVRKPALIPEPVSEFAHLDLSRKRRVA